MTQNLNRRDFIKTAAMGIAAVNTIGFFPNEKVFATDKCTVKTRYGIFNGFLDKNGVKTWLDSLRSTSRKKFALASSRAFETVK